MQVLGSAHPSTMQGWGCLNTSLIVTVVSGRTDPITELDTPGCFNFMLLNYQSIFTEMDMNCLWLSSTHAIFCWKYQPAFTSLPLDTVLGVNLLRPCPSVVERECMLGSLYTPSLKVNYKGRNKGLKKWGSLHLWCQTLVWSVLIFQPSFLSFRQPHSLPKKFSFHLSYPDSDPVTACKEP